MGPQGSGKTTQGTLLAEKYGLSFISVGSLLRKLGQSDDELGKEISHFINAGELVPDDTLRQVLEKYLHANSHPNGFVMDGFPRDKQQYQWVSEVFPEKITAVVFLRLELEEVLDRLIKRKEIEHREDETSEAIRERLHNYLEYTTEVIDRFRIDEVPFIEVDGSLTIEQIHQSIVVALEKIRAQHN